MAGSSSRACALTDSCSRWLQGRRSARSILAVFFAIASIVAGSSSLSAQAACPGPDPSCDGRRWRAPPPEPEPPPPSASSAGSGEEPGAWTTLLARENRPPIEPSVARWYGWQTLIGDGLAIASVIAGGGGEEGLLIAIGCGAALLATPAIHFAHENVLGGSVSFGMRALAGALITVGVLIAVDDIFEVGSDEETLGAAVMIGGLVAYAAAIIVDASVFAFDEVEPERPSYGFVPWLDPKRGSAGLQFSLVL